MQSDVILLTAAKEDLQHGATGSRINWQWRRGVKKNENGILEKFSWNVEVLELGENTSP